MQYTNTLFNLEVIIAAFKATLYQSRKINVLAGTWNKCSKEVIPKETPNTLHSFQPWNSISKAYQSKLIYESGNFVLCKLASFVIKNG